MPECPYPLTGIRCVDRLYTDLATFEFAPEGVRVLDLHGVTFAELSALVDVPLVDATSR